MNRELREELGVTASLRRVAYLKASERTGEEFIWLYHGEGSGPFAPARAEINALQFFSPAAISQWIERRPEDFAPGFIECWHAYAKTSASPNERSS